jgi:CRISPR-associated protein Csy2
MSQYILINKIEVQDANAIAGFTWGFPAITHFLGFTHNLSRKLTDNDAFNDLKIKGCVVISHNHHVKTYKNYGEYEFTQSRNPPYLASHDKAATPPVIEEGKMNMTVSLLIGFDGNIGNRKEKFIQWFEKTCFLQRLAGGTILNIEDIAIFNLSSETQKQLIILKRRLLPGFILRDRSDYLEKHYHYLQEQNPNEELIDAWLDFSSLKQKARPKSNLITKHLEKQAEKYTEHEHIEQLFDSWNKYLESPYQEIDIPDELISYFANSENQFSKVLIKQWQEYCQPTEKTDADWEYLKKPEQGYLVPIMVGYKAISKVYPNKEVQNTRDNKTDVCFVESVHSIGEWKSAHRIRELRDLEKSLWRYHYKENWYLCTQTPQQQAKTNNQKSYSIN